jgi:pyrroline-5-carboxylate reductase
VDSSSAYGFVGTGEITAAIVAGLSAGAAPPAVFLSPRNRRVADGLADRFPHVRVCGSNQEVLARAGSIVLAIRPQLAPDVLPELEWRPGHVVISAIAGVRLARLRAWTAPAADVVRSIPLPQAARGRSLTVMYPDHPAAWGLFERVGGVLVPDDEPALEAFSATTATFAAHLDYLATIASWLTDQGVGHDAATAYLKHIFADVGQSLAEHTGSLAELAAKHQTPGGTNEQFLGDLTRDGMPGHVRAALDHVLARLRR